MTDSIRRILFLLKSANFITILGNGIIWTGVSYDLSTRFGDPRFMGLMQVFSVIAGLLGPFLGLYLSSRFNLAPILIATECATAITCVAIFFILQLSVATSLLIILSILLLIFAILLSGSASSLFIEPIYASLVEKRDGSSENIKSEFAAFAYTGILSKLCGMSLGPLLVAWMGQFSLLLNSCSFLISMLLLQSAMRKVPSDIRIVKPPAEETYIFKKNIWKYALELPLCETAISNSMIFIVVLAMSTQAMSLQASATEISLFWFGATICSFLAHFTLSVCRLFADRLFLLERKFGFFQIIPIITGLLSNNILILLISQWCFSLLNPIATNQSRSDFYNIYGKGEGRVLDAYAMRSVMNNSIVLVFSLVISAIGTESIRLPLVFAITCLVCMRWGFARISFLRKKETEST